VPHQSVLETYLHTHIPISKALGVSVVKAHLDQVILSASFLANINHKKTVFGGSLQSVATLACWSLIYVNLKQRAMPYEIVITRSTIDYMQPVISDFQAVAERPSEDMWCTFLRCLERRQKGRIELGATIEQNDQLAVRYTGTFAALS
jgi:thioesterase domain-containing protein